VGEISLVNQDFKALELFMDAQQSIKHASGLARLNDFNAAILVMQGVVTELSKTSGSSIQHFVKVVPYFQKAGRYSELQEYCTDSLIPAVRNAAKLSFSHTNQAIIDAFSSLYTSKIYEKLQLAATREKCKADMSLFDALRNKFLNEYQRLLIIGEKLQLLEEYKQAIDLFGSDRSKWPDIIQEKFFAN
jgi:hypothetical protein|tara:strand:- start:497 stop:1063 length:567 start_codon:yes stop_codon:yes gene_type:complete